ncbi:MAG: dTMP kinase [Gemmataceae bacterium]|nr:dTMP kinase [Gemmataceae bacterium]
MPRGHFISLDGIDGAGKSTQCRLLADWLRGQGFVVRECADPGGTELGKTLREILLHQHAQIALPCEALLFMASRAQLVAEVIRPALDAGQTVLCDRFLLANVVYQGHGGGMDPEKLYQVGMVATGGVEPDLTMVLDLPLELTQQRRKPQADRMERRDAAFHARVRAGFLAEAAKRPERIIVVNASLPSAQVQATIREHTQAYLRKLG